MSLTTPIAYNQDLSSELTPGTALSVGDGRYRDKVQKLANKFSEAALQRARTTMEIRYLLALSEWEVIRPFTEQERQFLYALYQDFGVGEYNRVKQIERGPVARGADVKAVELYIKERH